MFKHLMKAAVGLVIEVPIAVLADTVSFLLMNGIGATEDALERVLRNLANATHSKEPQP